MKDYFSIAVSISITLAVLMLDKYLDVKIALPLCGLLICIVWILYFYNREKRPYKTNASFVSDRELYKEITEVLTDNFIIYFFQEQSYRDSWRGELLTPVIESALGILESNEFSNDAMNKTKDSLKEQIYIFNNSKEGNVFTTRNPHVVEVQPEWKSCNELKRDILCDEITGNSKKVYDAYFLFKNKWRDIENNHY